MILSIVLLKNIEISCLKEIYFIAMPRQLSHNKSSTLHCHLSHRILYSSLPSVADLEY